MADRPRIDFRNKVVKKSQNGVWDHGLMGFRFELTRLCELPQWFRVPQCAQCVPCISMITTAPQTRSNLREKIFAVALKNAMSRDQSRVNDKQSATTSFGGLTVHSS
jgi:hypothetical protein